MLKSIIVSDFFSHKMSKNNSKRRRACIVLALGTLLLFVTHANANVGHKDSNVLYLANEKLHVCVKSLTNSTCCSWLVRSMADTDPADEG